MATPQLQLDKPLPNSAEAERAILGGIIVNNGLLAEARTLLVPAQFYVPSHRRTFEGMIALAERGMAIDEVTLFGETAIEKPEIANLAYGLPRSMSIENYARMVRETAALRQIIKIGAKIQSAAIEEDDPQTILDQAQQDLFSVALQFRVDSEVRPYSEIGNAVMSLFEAWAEGKNPALPSQIPELDHKLAYGGFSPQQFIIIAARSSFGKTALALQIGLNVSRTGKSVLIASLEMPGEMLFMRNLASVTGVPYSKINPSTFQTDRETTGRIMSGISKLDTCPIQVADRVNELSQFCAVAREWKRQSDDPGLVIVDYLQLVKNKQQGRTRQEEVAGISSEMKRLATELDLPLIGVSQLNRKPAQENRRPELPDLRESGQLEQDADLVLFPWTEQGLQDVEVREMKLYCAKQRNGKPGWEIDIAFHGERQWFLTEQMIREQGHL